MPVKDDSSTGAIGEQGRPQSGTEGCGCVVGKLFVGQNEVIHPPGTLWNDKATRNEDDSTGPSSISTSSSLCPVSALDVTSHFRDSVSVLLQV